LAREVQITRTDYGVPHIDAPSLRHAAFGLAYAQSEDHGMRVFEGLIRARGHLAQIDGTAENVESDVIRRQTHARAATTWPELAPDAQAYLEGFAEGVNHYLALHPDERPQGVPLDFTGIDAHAMTIGWYEASRARAFVRSLSEPDSTGARQSDPADALWPDPHPDDGSNAWALAPERNPTQRALLLRNPHLSWDAGYYEAHLRVPGEFDFYGDFRVGGVFGIIAGFNAYLGWATTNNSPDLSVVYRIERDAELLDHYVLGGVSYPLKRTDIAIEARHAQRYAATGGQGTEVRTVRSTHVGPVIHEDSAAVYVIRSSDDGEFRRGEQFLAMMRSRSFEEFRQAMRMQRISASNYTYADRDGNIFYVWNAKLPKLPHAYEPSGAVPAARVADMWSEIHPFDSLPQLLNPEGGYLRNENDPPYFTNLNTVLERNWYPENMPEPRLRLRSQNSLRLLHGTRTFDLDDMVEAKHTMRMLLADRVKPDLLAAIRVTEASPEAREAARLLDAWDNTASRNARGAALFERWWREYSARVDSTDVFKEPWTPDYPVTTPAGLGRPLVAAQAFEAAVVALIEEHGSVDVAWGEVFRVRHGRVDVPVGGCPGDLGCFRVLGFRDGPDGHREVQRGDGWVLAVEFGDRPRAYSVLAYGQSSREGSRHFDDQAGLFADNAMKLVAYSDAEIAAERVARYRPGEEIQPGR